MTAEDRVALILGRAVMRAEVLQAEVERLRARLAEFENTTTSDDEETVRDR